MKYTHRNNIGKKKKYLFCFIGYKKQVDSYLFTFKHDTDRRGHNDWLLHIASATSAGLVSSTVMNPVWVIKTRFMVKITNNR
jgi:solute carrier family 25 folate transporter 32